MTYHSQNRQPAGVYAGMVSHLHHKVITAQECPRIPPGGCGTPERRGSRGATHHGHGSSAHFESATATRFTGTPLGVHPAQRVRIPPRSNHFPSASRQGMLTTRKTNVKTAASVGTTPMKPHYDDIQAAIEEAEQYLVDSQFRKDRRATHRWKLELRRLKRRGRR